MKIWITRIPEDSITTKFKDRQSGDLIVRLIPYILRSRPRHM
jgi:hypothetical protein